MLKNLQGAARVWIEDVNDQCLNNRYVSACLRRYFGNNSYRPAASRDEADVIVINGCNVMSDNSAKGIAARDFAKAHPEKKVLSVGCAARLGGEGPENFSLLPFWRMAEDTRRVDQAVGAQDEPLAPFRLEALDDVLPDSVRAGWSRESPAELSYLSLGSGCLSRCSFCAIKQGRGPLRSRPIEQIEADFEASSTSGRTRFVLVLDDVGSWGNDMGLDIVALLERLLRRRPEARFALPTFNPTYLPALFERLAPLLDSVTYLSLPIQSGSQRLLRLMEREYDIEETLGFAREIKRRFPKVFLNTDVIVAFPTETREEFILSVKAAMLFDSAVFPVFAPHPGTAAEKLQGAVPAPEVRRRVELLRRLAPRFGFDLEHQEPRFIWK